MPTPIFTIEKRTLRFDVESTGLEAFRWNSTSHGLSFFFIFINDVVHLIQTGKQDKTFVVVKTRTESERVRLISQEDLDRLAPIS